MKELIQLIDYIEKERDRVNIIRQYAVTGTEQAFANARMVDIDRILSEAYKIRDGVANEQISNNLKKG